MHCDLKPANVMVAGDTAVKVLDFGLAKLTGRDEAWPDEPTMTAHEALQPARHRRRHRALHVPEQALGGAVDARSDVFSFGATRHEMATGVPRSPGRSTADTLAAVIAPQPRPPTASSP